VHFKHEQPQVLSPDSHETMVRSSKHRSQPMCFESIYTIGGMRLDQRSFWDSWKLVGKLWRCQHEIVGWI